MNSGWYIWGSNNLELNGNFKNNCMRFGFFSLGLFLKSLGVLGKEEL
jgi:hypothetical protein